MYEGDWEGRDRDRGARRTDRNMEVGKLSTVGGLRERRPGKETPKRKGRGEEERQTQVLDLQVVKEMQIKIRTICYHQSAKTGKN